MDEHEIIASLIRIAEEEEVHALEVVVCADPGDPRSGSRYAVTLSAAGTEAAGEPEPEAAAPGAVEAAAPSGEPTPSVRVIRSPIVGTFRRGLEVGGAPLVEIGQEVTAGQTLGYVESLKVMRDMAAEVDGIVRGILAGDEEPVDYGRALFELEPKS